MSMLGASGGEGWGTTWDVPQSGPRASPPDVSCVKPRPLASIVHRLEPPTVSALRPKTIFVPSGDHAAPPLWKPPLVSWTSPEPSAAARESSPAYPPLSFRVNTMCRPSGDHAGPLGKAPAALIV